MLIADSDPRVFFAAERTQLAWLRTGLTVMAFGFVVARFGLFLEVVAVEVPRARVHTHSGVSAALGILFVALGAAAPLVATFQHRRFIATLSERDLPAMYSSRVAVIFGLLTGVLGLALAVYLALSQ